HRPIFRPPRTRRMMFLVHKSPPEFTSFIPNFLRCSLLHANLDFHRNLRPQDHQFTTPPRIMPLSIRVLQYVLLPPIVANPFPARHLAVATIPYLPFPDRPDSPRSATKP